MCFTFYIGLWQVGRDNTSPNRIFFDVFFYGEKILFPSSLCAYGKHYPWNPAGSLWPWLVSLFSFLLSWYDPNTLGGTNTVQPLKNFKFIQWQPAKPSRLRTEKPLATPCVNGFTFPPKAWAVLLDPLLGSLAGVGRCVQFNFHASDYTDSTEKHKHKMKKNEIFFVDHLAWIRQPDRGQVQAYSISFCVSVGSSPFLIRFIS